MSKILLILAISCIGSISGFGGFRRRIRSCDKTCDKEIEPVCGSDNVLYPSVCEMKRHNCKDGKRSSVFSVADENCMRSAGSECRHKCTSHFDPVCGSDGHAYLNKCMFRLEQCRSGITLAHLGPCIQAFKTEPCPKSCLPNKKATPICASDGNVYNSTCDMLTRTCGQKVVATNWKHCPTTQSCDSICFYDYKPVCGSDGRIYQSKCQMKLKNCGKHIFEMAMVNCLPQERMSTGCPITCADKLSPVCGSDGKIYDNECDMKRLNCGSGNALNIFSVNLKRCSRKFQTCGRINCPSTYDPVCGTDGKTYNNYCHMHKANCKKGIDLSHYGKCSSPNTIENCDECTVEEKQFQPICGSNGNVYFSICDMKRRTCKQKVVAVSNYYCEATKYCNADCSKKKSAAVCGSDGKMYRNVCEMKANNCGRHVYEVPLGDCLKGFDFFKCMRFCPPTFDPVCGTDGKTYSNECFLKMENCRSRSLGRSLVTRTYYGRCGYPQKKAKHYMFR